MTLLCKNKALYVKACIIQNGVPDTDGDILNSEDIKKIFTSFNSQNNFEINHNELPITEVSLMENYISQSEEVIANTTIPKGSWNCVIRVDNPNVKEKLLSGEFGGVSLNNRVQERCAKNLNGEVDYKDIKDMECIIPLLISFVGEPANRVGLHIMDYNTYIQKSKNKSDSISNTVKSDNMSLIEKLKSIIAEEEEAEPVEETQEVSDADDAEIENAEDGTEKEEEEEVEVEKEDTGETETEPATEEKEDDDDAVDEEKVEVEKSETTTTETSEVTVEKDNDEETAEETEINKEEVDDVDKYAALENRISAIEDKINQLIGETNPIEDDAIPNSAEEPLITKSSKIEIVEEPRVSNFYELSGRDPITGKRIRKQSKILN